LNVVYAFELNPAAKTPINNDQVWQRVPRSIKNQNTNRIDHGWRTVYVFLEQEK